MDSKDWEIRAISSKVISKYESILAKEKLKKNLGDSNYFVRYNSAFSFIYMVEEQNVINEALNNEDLFAREIIIYAMHVKGLINFDQYNELIGNVGAGEVAVS